MTCLPVDCCFSELALWKYNSSCWSSTKQTSSSSSSNPSETYYRHDMAEKLFICSLCLHFFHLLARKPNLEKNSIYSINSFIIFTCPGLQANVLVWILHVVLNNNHSLLYFCFYGVKQQSFTAVFLFLHRKHSHMLKKTVYYSWKHQPRQPWM